MGSQVGAGSDCSPQHWVPLRDTRELRGRPGKAALAKKCQVRRITGMRGAEVFPGDGEGAAVGGGASSLPLEAVVELLPRELCWEQAGLESPAGHCQPCSILHLLGPGRDSAQSCSHPQLAWGPQCPPDTAPALGNGPGGSDRGLEDLTQARRV